MYVPEQRQVVAENLLNHKKIHLNDICLLAQLYHGVACWNFPAIKLYKN